MQHSVKLGGTNYHFKWVKVPGTAGYWKACTLRSTVLQQCEHVKCWSTTVFFNNIRKGSLNIVYAVYTVFTGNF